LSDRRFVNDQRSGSDTRSSSEQQLMGERRSGIDRRVIKDSATDSSAPPHEHLALFARRMRRAIANEKARTLFGTARSEYDFSVHTDVLRTIEWIESLVASAQASAQTTIREQTPR
jgi:hypothetical protein